LKVELHTAHVKQCTWNTRSRARITISVNKMAAWHRAQRFIPNNLQHSKAFYAPKMHKKCTKNASKLHQKCTKNALKMHQKCIKTAQKCIKMHKNAPKMHKKMQQNASKMHQKCIKIAPKMHKNAPKMHKKCTKNASKLHQKCIKMHQNASKCIKNASKMHQKCTKKHQKCIKNAFYFPFHTTTPTYYFEASLYVGDRLVCRFGWNCSSIQTCTPDGHLNRVTYTRYRINTINSPDDEHRGARNT